MTHVYELIQAESTSTLLELYEDVDSRFVGIHYGWKHVCLSNYKPLTFKLYTNSSGYKNFKSDVFVISGPLLVLSQDAKDVLNDVLVRTGQILPIITESKRKHFYGFYPNKNVYSDSIINLNKSEWRQVEHGKIINKLVLNSTYPKADYLFVLEDEPMIIYVTDKFKALVESNNLVGFDFSRKIEVSD